MDIQPTIFHITNYKAGSQWVAEILKHSAPERFIKPETEARHFLENASIPGMIYPTVYITQQHFTSTMLSGKFYRFHYPTNIAKNTFAKIKNIYNYRVQEHPYKVFIIIRDLRDIMISKYFSLLISHRITSEEIKRKRESLNRLSKDEGLAYMMNNTMMIEAKIQSSWYPVSQNGQALLIRYEELLEDEHKIFEKIINFCGIEVNLEKLHNIVTYNSFKVATGRERGQEDIHEHLRKGITGDWKNHFSTNIKEQFKNSYGDVLIQTGYETDLNW